MSKAVSILFSAWLAMALLSSVSAVEKIPELSERVRMVLKYGHSAQVRDALGRVSKLKEEEQKNLLPELQALLNSEDLLIQKKLVDIVSEVSWSDLDEPILVFFDSKSDDVFFALTNTIEKKEIRPAIPKIHSYFDSADFTQASNKITTLLRILGKLKETDKATFLYEKAKSSETHAEFRREIIKYFGDAGVKTEEITAWLRQTAIDEDAEINLRAYCVYALGKNEIADSASELKGILAEVEKITDLHKKREYAPLRTQLITALIRLGDSEVESILLNLARDDDDTVRLRAVRQLGQLKLPSSVDLLKYKAQYDSNFRIQKEAKKALKDMGIEVAEPAAETAEKPKKKAADQAPEEADEAADKSDPNAP